MAKKSKPKIVAQMIISVYDDDNVELEHTSNFDLSKRIVVLTQTLERQIHAAEALNSLTDNRNLPS